MLLGKSAASPALEVQVPSIRKYRFVALLLITLFIKAIFIKRRPAAAMTRIADINSPRNTYKAGSWLLLGRLSGRPSRGASSVSYRHKACGEPNRHQMQF